MKESRLSKIEREIRELRDIIDRMLSSDLIRKETYKSFHKDLKAIKLMFPNYKEEIKC